ncbi:DUF4270 domain-containing protein [Psychroserpens sp. XS_ASV72]|uniref:DUF4270 domain-containing protein n=1 Tax=Psychroserpens sp. XS_ASV72 TaxID=3241293 RepID=UPI003519835A
MKHNKIALRNFVVILVLTSLFIACDKDFATIESAIINDDNASNFGTDSRDFEVIAFSKALPPVQTNNLPVNLLGVYDDPIYGRTTASFVTQVTTSFVNFDFGENPVLDSVVVTIPYFSTPIELTSDGETIYELDSVFGNSPYDLKIYESNYFLRNFDPNSEINDPQIYYSNKSTGSSPIDEALLEGTLLKSFDDFVPDPSQIELWDEDGDVTNRLAPSLRFSYKEPAELAYWVEKFINKSGEPELSNQNNLSDYFRGLYFKVESNTMDGNMAILNLNTTSANITLYYKRDSSVENDDPIASTYVLNFNGNRVNFLSNDFTFTNGDEVQGDEKLYLKGGEGSMAVVKLFDGENIDDDDLTFNSFEEFKNEFVEVDADGNFVKSKKIINEANLVFYVDQSSVANVEEPERILIFDMKNNIPLIDYFYDSANTLNPVNSRTSHLGKLQKEGNSADGNGVKYKIRLTEHINNILIRDSTNVDLGLVVSGNVNLESNLAAFDILSTNDSDEKIPASSIVTQRGTVLYGNNVADEQKKLYLEIFYTEPNN